MKSRLVTIIYCSALLLGSLFITGCIGDEGESSPSNGLGNSTSASTQASSTSYPNIRGSWSGVYGVLGGSTSTDGQSLTAQIKQDRDAVVINTTLPTFGRLFTGSIDPNGKMTLTDAFDGETWTTHFGSATATSIRIADFLERPTVENPDPPIAVIQLNR